MTYVVAATWRAKEGEEAALLAILAEAVQKFRAEPACRMFVAHRSTEDPRAFLLYEQYDDEAGFHAHVASDAFAAHILGDAVARLETRQRTTYETLD